VATRKEDHEKRETLRRVIRAQGDELTNAIIFCNRKRDVALLYRSLEKHGFSVGALHGDMDQRARMMTLQSFRDNKITLLVASDVAARGLDIPMVSHVFNFDVPIHAEDYVHRIGRTGRAGRSGKSFTLVTKAERKALDAITSLIGREIDWLDGDLSALPQVDDAGDDDGRRGSSRRGSREGRSSPRAPRARTERSRGSASTEEAPVADTVEDGEAEAAVVAAIGVEAAASIVARPVEASRPPRQVPPQQHDRNGRRRDAGRDEPSPVGFGEDVPAFMLIPTGA